MSNDPYLQLANDSGYPLQIAVQREIENTTSQHNWRVKFAEHSWFNLTDGTSGFIDLVVENRASVVYLVIECKRVRDSTWLFMEPSGQASPVTRSKAWISNYREGQFKHLGWFDVHVTPPSPEGLFCALRGQNAHERNTLLERTGAELVTATEGLAAEIRDYRPDFPEDFRIYFNVIVTTADLVVAKFAPDQLSPSHGTLATAQFESAPFVRLRKQLSRRPRSFDVRDFQRGVEPTQEKESTVFVVRAEALAGFLRAFDVSTDGMRRFHAA